MIWMNVFCPYCNCPAMLLDASYVYGPGSRGSIWFCLVCGAYVGCHPGSTKALGTPADKATRWARHMAHEAFDPIWRSRRMSRSGAYQWLARQMGLPPEQTHIGMFTQAQCGRVIQICMERRLCYATSKDGA